MEAYVLVLLVGLAAGVVSGIIGKGSSIMLLPVTRPGLWPKASRAHHGGRRRDGECRQSRRLAARNQLARIRRLFAHRRACRRTGSPNAARASGNDDQCGARIVFSADDSSEIRVQI